MTKQIIIVITLVLSVAIMGYLILVNKVSPAIQDIEVSTPASTSTQVENIPITPSATNTQTVSLQSEFLKNQPIAQQIISGQLKTYDIKKYGYVYGFHPSGDENDFAYRFMNAIKMTGQIIYGGSMGGHYLSEDVLNRFQAFWGFPISSNIDSQVLKKVDSILASREANESSIATSFPLYDHLTEAPPNQETKTHVAYIFAQAFKELPENLVVWNEQNFKNFFIRQLPAWFNNIDSNNYQVCNSYLYDNIGDNCKPITNAYNTTDDFQSMSLVLHEYAHYLDRNLYPRNTDTSQGLIETTKFYDISFDTTQKDLTAYWPSFKLKNPDNKHNEFIGAYAMGWTTSDGYNSIEDFAESFTMYITQGKAFRAIADTNLILKQKYDWLKQNVFNGIEYNSGASDALKYTKDNPNKATVATGVYNIIDFTSYYPNFVWNYQFLNGSMLNK